MIALFHWSWLSILIVYSESACVPKGGYIATTHVGGRYEGFGSIVRGTFLPLLQLSIESGLTIALPEEFFWGKNKRNYTTLDFREFFGLSECTLENIREL